MATPAREALHQLAGVLPDDQIVRSSRFREALLSTARDDGAHHSLDTAPEDDEPETPEERSAVEEALRDLREGRTVPHAEIVRRWGSG